MIFSFAVGQASSGSEFGLWFGPVYFEDVMCNGDEYHLSECEISGEVGTITNPGCLQPNRTAGVRCIEGETTEQVCIHTVYDPLRLFHVHLQSSPAVTPMENSD